jgi:hypothetical protein
VFFLAPHKLCILVITEKFLEEIVGERSELLDTYDAQILVIF